MISTDHQHTPRWFYIAVLAALAAIAAATWLWAQNGRYVLDRDGGAVLDTRTGEICGPSSAGVRCVNVVEQGRRAR